MQLLNKNARVVVYLFERKNTLKVPLIGTLLARTKQLSRLEIYEVQDRFSVVCWTEFHKVKRIFYRVFAYRTSLYVDCHENNVVYQQKLPIWG